MYGYTIGRSGPATTIHPGGSKMTTFSANTTASNRVAAENDAIAATRSNLFGRERDGEDVNAEFLRLGDRQRIVNLALDVVGIHPILSIAERIDRDVPARHQAAVRALVGVR
jgi:hypothetical protein